MEIKKVDYRFKIMYVFGIIAILNIHCGYGGASFYGFFQYYTIALGLFMFTSGYFHKKDGNDFFKYVKKKIKTLLVPLYLWNLFYACVVTVMHDLGFAFGEEVSFSSLFIKPIISGHQFEYNLGGWCIVPLFLVQVYNAIVRKTFSLLNVQINEYIFFLFNLGLGIAGVSLAICGFNSGVWLLLVRFCYFIPTFGLGMLYRNKIEKYDNLPNLWYFTILIVIQMIIYLVCGEIPVVRIAEAEDFFYGPVLPFIVDFSGAFFVLRIAKILTPVLKDSKLLKIVADNTYTIMINQILGFMFIKSIFAGIDFVIEIGFDWEQYTTNLWYYFPEDLEQLSIIYVAGAIAFSIGLQILFKKICFWLKTYIARLI